nr:hypothetical protein [Bradyrhizobium sp. 76]
MPDGRELVTLEDAGHYVAAMPAAQQRHAHWQTAAEFLLLVAERGGDLLMARTDMMRALNHGILVSIVEPRRKRSRNYTLIR